ncbi:MAG: Transcriptional regulator, TrmB [Berkelbacteria bacterium GW2011_GWA2_38_9]|uniref:Transcriptional regulator, TrmB n=1 Tax=Berkelbacteria bacterium GW2011_GWA2_38_9 TaxID=1618334 RepID=A0A0G0PLR3_9BACT|nr:MAG: Transcriptional regulator, TrmB [Berkelbacteria bacterium GW2011_GWA2_38_9]
MILEHNKKIYQTLLTLGLTDKQALIYLAALVSGGGTVTDLAKEAQIERTGIYNYLEDLIHRGLLRESTKGKRTIYLASDPTKLKELLREKEQALEESLAKMQSMFSQNTGQSLVSYYQGKEGIINLYLEMEKIEEQMTADECIYIFATTHGGFEFFPDFLTKLFERRAKMVVPTKSIHPISEKPSKKELVSEEPGTKTKNAWHIRDKKYIPDKYIKEQIGTIVIARDFVSMVDYKNAFGSITENKNLANTWRMFFQFIWEHL